MADVMLGRLARWLRALGYDTLYIRDAGDSRLLGIALRERRCLLTRDAALATRGGAAALRVRAQNVDLQLREVMSGCGLRATAPLTRCLECNGVLVAAAPASVATRIAPYTLASHREFRECEACRRVFWAGTHASAIRRRLEPYLAPAAAGVIERADGSEAS